MRGARNLIIALVFSLVMPVTAFGHGISCLNQATLRSTAAGRPAIITFVNNSRYAVNIYWIDYAGHRAQQFYLTPGSVITRNTLVTHPWVITDEHDNCIGVAFANPSAPNVEITDSAVVFSGTSGPALAGNPADAKQAKHGGDEAGGPAALAQKIDLLCTNNGGAGRTDVLTFDLSARTLTWAQDPDSPIHIKSIRKTKTGYVLQTATKSNLVVYINGKDSRLEVHDGNYTEKDPCHVISDLRQPTNAESVGMAPAAAAPLAQDRAKLQPWMFSAASGRGYISSGLADDGFSRFTITCLADSQSVDFTFYPDGYHGHALNKVMDLEQPFVVEFRQSSGDNQKFPILAYFVADGGWTQEARRHRTGSEASAFLDAVGQDGRLDLQTGKGAEIASWTLKGTSQMRESMRKVCNL